jgi:hypothetical protein
MKRFASVLVAGAALLALNTESFAGANANAKIAVHVMSTTTKNLCNRARVDCSSIVTSAALYPALNFAYVLVTDGNAAAGLSGAQFGISYDGPGAADGLGLDIYTWSGTACIFGDYPQPAPAWPNSGGGTLVTWATCQNVEPGGAGTGVVAVIGYFYCAAYSPACLRLGPRPIDNAGKVADCAANEDIITGTPSHYGTACFGTAAGPGYNPCGLVTPVESTTWSAIKSNYN